MKRRTTIMITIISGVSTIVSGYLEKIASNTPLPPFLTPYLPFAWPAFLAVSALTAGIAVWQTFRQEETGRPESTPEKQNRQRMLERVGTKWFTGPVEHSLSDGATITLGLKARPDAIADPLQQPNRSEREWPLGTRITAVYDRAGGELLILGEPGSGKTTLLLELTRDLLDRAHRDENYPMPVVFPLSSWTVKRLPITDWLVEELHEKYYISRKIARSWVEADQILPLLDGLDEVAQEGRAACVDAINAYRKEHGLLPTVVCSRSIEYDDLVKTQHRLQLQSAVVVQPLIPQQIEDYLSRAGEKLEPVRLALHEDPDLQELAATPLMLNVLTLAYSGRAVDDLLVASTPEARRQQIFTTYIEQMLHDHGARPGYSPQQMVYWLSWLARQLTQRSQIEFYLERMQPDLLPEGSSRLKYQIVVSLVVGLLGGLPLGMLIGLLTTFHLALLAGPVSGLLTGLLSGLLEPNILEKLPFVRSNQGLWSPMRKKLVAGLVIGPLVGLVIGLLVGLLFGLRNGLLVGLVIGLLVGLFGALFSRLRSRLLIGLKGGLPAGVFFGLFVGLFLGLPAGLFVGLLGELAFGLPVGIGGELRNNVPEQSLAQSNRGIGVTTRNGVVGILLLGLLLGLVDGLRNGLLAGLVYGLVVGLFLGLPAWLFVGPLSRLGEIQPAETVTWRITRENVIQALLMGLFVGLLVGLLVGLREGLLVGLVGGLLIGLVAGLPWLLEPNMLEKRTLMRPNQGIWDSARHGIVGGLLYGLVIVLVIVLVVLVYWLNTGQVFRLLPSRLPVVLLFGLLYGLLVGLSSGLALGGLATIQHVILRWFLWRTGTTPRPRQYIAFLNYATACILLRRFGGGYIFIHRLLQDYFASLEPGSSPQQEVTQAQHTPAVSS